MFKCIQLFNCPAKVHIKRLEWPPKSTSSSLMGLKGLNNLFKIKFIYLYNFSQSITTLVAPIAFNKYWIGFNSKWTVYKYNQSGIW